MDQRIDIDDMKGRGRIESGRIQFNDDWPGVFIRGDQAMMYFSQLLNVLNSAREAKLPDEDIKSIEMLIDLMQSCRIN